jgi:hypothetical protein
MISRVHRGVSNLKLEGTPSTWHLHKEIICTPVVCEDHDGSIIALGSKALTGSRVV